MKKIYNYKTSIGDIGIIECDSAIEGVCFGNDAPYKRVETPLIKKTYEQITEYLEGKRKTFDVPIKPSGTEFQKAVWSELLKIPYGEVRTYGAIAKSIGSINAARPVGGACNQNPIAIIIPCHRVIGSNGSLTGYAGGLDVKRKLLEAEAKWRVES